MSPARLKTTFVVLIIAASGAVLLGWTQEWFRVTLVGAGGEALAVPGSIASPALSALGLAGLALAAALAIAGLVIRIVLGVLGVALGFSAALAAGLALGDPLSAAAPAVTTATGISGADSVAALVATTEATAWPIVALVAGVLLGLSGAGVVVTAARWPRSSRRYRAVRFEGAETSPGTVSEPPSARDRAIDEWDELTRGDDPTGTAGEPPATR